MAVVIRNAVADDKDAWLELVRAAFGEDHPSKQIYEPDWIAEQLSTFSGHETWIAEEGGKLVGAITILNFAPLDEKSLSMSRAPRDCSNPDNPVCNLGRNLFTAAGHAEEAGGALLAKISELAKERGQMAIVRVLASDNEQQILFEQAGFVCVGFQPDKHFHRIREEVLYYIRPTEVAGERVALSNSLPQINELASAAMANLNIPGTERVDDGGTGYPLKTDIEIIRVNGERYEKEREAVRSANPPTEISGGFNTGHGFMREDREMPTDAFLAERDGKIVGGVHFIFDELDRCVRILNAFCTDGLSLGAMLQHLLKISNSQYNAFYVEVDILISSVRLLISAEQLGFVPSAYLPGFHRRGNDLVDVVKLVKFNQNFEIEECTLTSQAEGVSEVVRTFLDDQASGVAIVNLLRDLTIFRDLGDGELHKLARLFTQKLVKAWEGVFDRDDAGEEAFVIMRGQVDIFLDEKQQPIASFGAGQVFGEFAFLDGGPRGAKAVAAQPTILLIIRRSEFRELTQREPNLGLTVMKNLALEMADRLRKMNATMLSHQR